MVAFALPGVLPVILSGIDVTGSGRGPGSESRFDRAIEDEMVATGVKAHDFSFLPCSACRGEKEQQTT